MDDEENDKDDEEAEEEQSDMENRHCKAAKRPRGSLSQAITGSNEVNDDGEEPHDDVEEPAGSRIPVKQKPKGRKTAFQRPGKHSFILCSSCCVHAETSCAEDSFKPIQSLTVDTLAEEVLDLRRELQACDDMDTDDDETYEDIKTSLDEANQAVGLGGIRRRALDGIKAIAQDSHRLSQHIEREVYRL